MKPHICPECGHLFLNKGKTIEVRIGFADGEDGLIETFRIVKNVVYCINCAPAYDAEWEGVYYKEVQCTKDGKIIS